MCLVLDAMAKKSFEPCRADVRKTRPPPGVHLQMKRVNRLTGVIAVAMLLAWAFAQSVSATAAPYDVAGRNCANDVQKLQYIGVISGYTDGSFKPDNPIRRCEMAKIIALCKNLSLRSSQLAGPTRFPDVAADHWASGFINAAVETAIIQGYTDGYFRPDNNVTYAEVITMLVRAVGWAPVGGVWPDNYLAVAAAKGITEGVAFQAGKAATRGDVAILASRAVFGVTQPSGITLGSAYGVGQQMEVHFIDVGQGTAVLVVTPARNALLVDAGPIEKASSLVAYIKSLNITDIDAFVMSSAYSDNLGGMSAVLDNFTVKSFYDPGYAYSGSEYQEVKNKLPVYNVHYHTIRCGTQVEVDPWIGVVAANPGVSGGDITASSVVLKVTMGEVDFLLAGDADATAQGHVMVQSFVQPTADVLLVPSHGSATAVVPEFLSMVDPSVAIVSVGAKNAFGWPAVSTLYQLANYGADFYRTDLHGTVTITTNGKTYSVKTNPPVPDVPFTGFYGDTNTRVFHLPTCSYLPASQFRVKFDTRTQAIQAGYVPCGDCEP